MTLPCLAGDSKMWTDDMGIFKLPEIGLLVKFRPGDVILFRSSVSDLRVTPAAGTRMVIILAVTDSNLVQDFFRKQTTSRDWNNTRQRETNSLRTKRTTKKVRSSGKTGVTRRVARGATKPSTTRAQGGKEDP